MKTQTKLAIVFLSALLVCLAVKAVTILYPVTLVGANPGGTLLIQSGGCNTAAAGFVSNSFPVPFASPPQVFVQQVGITNSPTNEVGSVSTTGFCITNSQVNVSNFWYALGSAQ